MHILEKYIEKPATVADMTPDLQMGRNTHDI